MLHITDEQRRVRLARRHALAPSARVATPEDVVDAMTVLHATEPATVFLSCWARGDTITRAGVERALYTERTVVKQLAMRRTLFVFPRDLLAAAWGSASARVQRAERARIARDVEAWGIADDGTAWLDRACAEVLDLVRDDPAGRTALEVRAGVPLLEHARGVCADAASIHGRVLTTLGLGAELVRGDNTGHWRVSRPRWTPMRSWLADAPELWGSAYDERSGYREIVRRWLRTFGPGTVDDVQWWLGATKTAVRAALDDLDAVPVSLDRGDTGWVLPDDLDALDAPEPWVALLPILDPTTMGWKQRGFYLDDLAPQLFDRNGNAGTTAWVDGRVVGCWVQDDAGVVDVRLLTDVEEWARRALVVEADRLTDWLGGERVGTVYPSSAMRARAGVSVRR